MNKNYNFGYTKVNSKQKNKLVQNVFSNVASKYDLMNDLMSMGMHRLWKKRFIELINPNKHDVIIDVGSGSGDIANEILKLNFIGKIYLLDQNKQMLNLGRKKLNNNKYTEFVLGNAEKLDFKNDFFDKYSISFCLRNITNLVSSIKEAHRVLKPGGKYFCLEFSTPESIIINKSYKMYKSNILPFLGKLVSGNYDAYKYLSESIDMFPNQDELRKIISDCGFKNVSSLNLLNGIVAIHIGYKI